MVTMSHELEAAKVAPPWQAGWACLGKQSSYASSQSLTADLELSE